MRKGQTNVGLEVEVQGRGGIYQERTKKVGRESVEERNYQSKRMDMN
jgi:hypothetical protein